MKNKKEKKEFRNLNKKKLNPQKYIIGEHSSFSVKESYKAARTNLMFTLADEPGCKKVLVTSAGAGDGKTTTTMNLAITFAQTGAKVLVLDTDLRRPKLHACLGEDNKEGLAQYLGGFQQDIKNIIIHSEEHQIDCITSGAIPPNPSELLISGRMQELINTLSEDYDYIFIDSPPINSVTDAVSLSKFMTGAVLVVRLNQTVSEELERAVHALEFSKTKILGFVLNGVKNRHRNKYKKYSYGYYYGY